LLVVVLLCLLFNTNYGFQFFSFCEAEKPIRPLTGPHQFFGLVKAK